MTRTVVVRRRGASYPAPAFYPPEIYPEIRRLGVAQTDPGNSVYPMVRRALALLGLDRAREGSPDWNPMGDLIDAGSRVVVKPNFVQHYEHAGSLVQLVTHPAVLRPILDYLLLAQGSLENVSVLDAPEIDCDFEILLARLGWHELRAHYERLGHALRVTDIRPERADYAGGGAIVSRRALPGDPRGFVSVDLGASSALAPVAGRGRFYGADYDRKRTNESHTAEVNRYEISRTFLEADLVVSVPKLKTHKKAGITGAVKNLVGVAGDKNLLPHYAIGHAAGGGCEYSAPAASSLLALSRRADRLYRDLVLSRRFRLAGRLYNAVLDPLRERWVGPLGGEGQTRGDWWGNDVLWRTIVDLNRILLCAGPDGSLAERPRRRQLAIVDAVVAGEGEGPHRATPRALGAVLAGTDGFAVDRAAAAILGFDPARIPQLAEAARFLERAKAAAGPERAVLDDDGDVREVASESLPVLDGTFLAPPGWRGHVEKTAATTPTGRA